jgi:hypothetical protein
MHEVSGQKAKMKGSTEQLGHISHIQFPHQIEAMNFDGAHTDLQFGGDFAVGVPD